MSVKQLPLPKLINVKFMVLENRKYSNNLTAGVLVLRIWRQYGPVWNYIAIRSAETTQSDVLLIRISADRIDGSTGALVSQLLHFSTMCLFLSLSKWKSFTRVHIYLQKKIEYMLRANQAVLDGMLRWQVDFFFIIFFIQCWKNYPLFIWTVSKL